MQRKISYERKRETNFEQHDGKSMILREDVMFKFNVYLIFSITRSLYLNWNLKVELLFIFSLLISKKHFLSLNEASNELSP